jgi:hypothetical protein
MPGTSPAEAMRVVAGNSPTSRTCPSCQTAGRERTSPAAPPRCWSRSRSRSPRAAGRLAEHLGRNLARTMLSSDLDVMEEVLDGFRGPLKI